MVCIELDGLLYVSILYVARAVCRLLSACNDQQWEWTTPASDVQQRAPHPRPDPHQATGQPDPDPNCRHRIFSFKYDFITSLCNRPISSEDRAVDSKSTSRRFESDIGLYNNHLAQFGRALAFQVSRHRFESGSDYKVV